MISSVIAQEVSQLHAELCSALADPTRLIILYTLAEKPHNVTELTQSLKLSQPTISRHLKVLRDRNLVIGNRQGTTMLYTIADHRIIDALDILRSIMRDRIQYRANLIDEYIST